MSALTPWPDALVGTPAIAVIEQAIARQRLSHSLLLHGDDLETLVAIAHGIADRLLNGEPGKRAAATFPTEQHPDCFSLRPTGKMRQISADATRELITKVQVSPAVAPRKVAILHEVDRMHLTAANVFLKTLEEPPAHTTLLLLTTRPYALLPTIRSRVLHFRFPSAAAPVAADGWAAWIGDYQAWLGRLVEGATTDKQAVADHIFTLYGLVARFGAVLDFATAEVWKQQKAKLPADLEDDEQVAIETGIANGLRARLFVEIEQATRAFALPRLNAGDEPTRRALIGSIEKLEHDVGLLRLNLNESAALEGFLLSSLRFWTKR
ncbi:DNA polymerase III subunit gamma/tau [Horticoccus sp. 23ND18S-11]|uniref:DNA polymerase III subunit gamma/tau n=1 Tax=Horticoccus sp. 23ND18S-11 TaxID=3391832 RepID=UPI0039C8D5D2